MAFTWLTGFTVDGNVGIGADIPAAKLDVQGTILVNNEIKFVDGNMRIFRSTNDMRFRTSGSDRMTILGTGDVCIGTTTPSFNTNYGTGDLNVENDTFASAQVFTHNSTVGNYSFFGLGKSNGTGASPTIVQAQETVGAMGWYGYDGAAYKRMATIQVDVDGTPGAGDMPGRIEIGTTPDGASGPTTRMVIDNAGLIRFNSYGVGTLVTDSSGNITASSGGGEGGPYLPLAGGTMDSGAAITFNVPNAGGSFINIDHSGNESWTIAAQSGVGVDDYLDIGISGGNRAMSWHETGRVGIGTNSPDGELEVVTSTVVSGASDSVNNVLIGLQSANRPTIILDTADTTYTNRTWNITNVGSAGSLFIGRNGLDVMVMDNAGATTFSGNVGIGSAPVGNPGTKILAVGTAGSVAGGIQLWAANTQTHYLQFGDANSGGEVYRGGIGYAHASETLLLLQGSVTALSFTGTQAATFAGEVLAPRFNVGTDSLSIIQESSRMKFTNAIAGNSNGFDFFTRNSSSTYINALQILGTGNATFAIQAFATTATSSGDASSNLTTKGYVDSLITGATIYRGTWQAGISATSAAATSASTTLTVSAAILDAAGNTPVLVGAVVTGAGITGTVKVATVTSSTVYVLDTAINATATAYIFSPIYGAPDLSGVTQTSGYYYICSEAGSATPNGAGTEPNTWGVGDWVIWNDDVGSGEWQKVDNSSVLSGAGTGQTVALWEGPASVTDSETLGNAPITVSGDNTNFTGNVGIGIAAQGNRKLSIQNTNADNEIEFYGTDFTNIYSRTNSGMTVEVLGTGYVKLGTTGGNLTIVNGGAATFTSNVALTGDLKVTAEAATADIVAQWADSNGNNTATFRTTTPGQIFEIRSQNSGTLKFDSTSSTFTGDIIIPNGKISTTGGNNLTLSGSVADHAGIIFATNSILPAVISVDTNNVVDLGQNGNVFKNLYLGSEIISGGGATFGGSVKVSDDTADATAAKAGAIRYRTGTEYVEVTGIELVTNGDFAADTNWVVTNTNWAISSGKANFTGSATAALYQSITLTNAVTYRVRFNVSGSSGAGAFIWIGNSQGSVNYLGGTYKYYLDGDFEEIFTMPSSQTVLAFYSNATSSGYSLDNVTLLEVTEEDASYADMCMQTGASTYEWVNIVRNTY